MIPGLEVHTSLPGREDVMVGTCRFGLRRGQISSVFCYDDLYLSHPDAYAIDPALPLRAASYHSNGVHGALRDSAPDRWGRHLIDWQALYNGDSGVAGARCLDELDYLIGVSDVSRQGALRYALPGGKTFLSAEGEVPPIVELKRLLHSAREVAFGNDGKEQVKELLEAGSASLGGARPKASVVDEGKILLAKFSHPGDEWDVITWEKVALEIAMAAGIRTPRSKLLTIGSSSVLLLERFDRFDSLLEGERIPYLSAMSLIGGRDGLSYDYVEVAEALVDWASNARAELEKLFRRAALSVAINNTDDHLRNLGLLREEGRWGFSPAFDININPDLRHTHVTAVYGETGAAIAESLGEFAEVCEVGTERARSIVASTVNASRQCAAFAKKHGCKQAEITLLAGAVENRCAALEKVFGL
ncbi:type II toxin-antitoxin system HipA family toxin [Paratractidigestivibacter sp.]|uniref:type II toxin-antitoxin system HipA family toxin n=2 Tax=Paratractidigestivibacter sp. TaxID=2847316 RepID=UPI002AC8B239|nr:type II toxin-antitoxin system HipA family toxin [Paratractidigestivibacter sp.]